MRLISGVRRSPEAGRGLTEEVATHGHRARVHGSGLRQFGRPADVGAARLRPATAGIGALADRIVGVQVPRQPRRGPGQKRRRRPLRRGLRDAQRILSAGPGGAFLTAACSTIGEALLEIPTRDGRWIRCVFGLDGYFLVSETIDDRPWATALSASIGILRRLAPVVDYGLIRRSDFLAGSLGEAVDYGRSRPQNLLRTYADSHLVLKEAVPDIFGVQLFGPQHQTLLPSDNWDVADLPAGRKLVSSKRLEDWYGDDLPVESVQQHAREANTAVLYFFERWLERNLRAHAHHKTT